MLRNKKKNKKCIVLIVWSQTKRHKNEKEKRNKHEQRQNKKKSTNIWKKNRKILALDGKTSVDKILNSSFLFFASFCVPFWSCLRNQQVSKSRKIYKKKNKTEKEKEPRWGSLYSYLVSVSQVLCFFMRERKARENKKKKYKAKHISDRLLN